MAVELWFLDRENGPVPSEPVLRSIRWTPVPLRRLPRAAEAPHTERSREMQRSDPHPNGHPAEEWGLGGEDVA